MALYVANLAIVYVFFLTAGVAYDFDVRAFWRRGTLVEEEAAPSTSPSFHIASVDLPT